MTAWNGSDDGSTWFLRQYFPQTVGYGQVDGHDTKIYPGGSFSAFAPWLGSAVAGFQPQQPDGVPFPLDKMVTEILVTYYFGRVYDTDPPDSFPDQYMHVYIGGYNSDGDGDGIRTGSPVLAPQYSAGLVSATLDYAPASDGEGVAIAAHLADGLFIPFLGSPEGSAISSMGVCWVEVTVDYVPSSLDAAVSGWAVGLVN